MTSLLVPHARATAAVVRRALLRELRQQGVAGEVVDDAMLVMSELVGNAVRHGRPLPGQHIQVSWWIVDQTLHVEVWDGGPGLPAHAAPTVLSPSAEGGRGLPIVDLLSARWGTRAAGPQGPSAVHAELPLAASRAGSPAGAARCSPPAVPESASA